MSFSCFLKAHSSSSCQMELWQPRPRQRRQQEREPCFKRRPQLLHGLEDTLTDRYEVSAFPRLGVHPSSRYEMLSQTAARANDPRQEVSKPAVALRLNRSQFTMRSIPSASPSAGIGSRAWTLLGADPDRRPCAVLEPAAPPLSAWKPPQERDAAEPPATASACVRQHQQQSANASNRSQRRPPSNADQLPGPSILIALLIHDTDYEEDWRSVTPVLL